MIMKYNFDKIPNRRGTNSLKWDVDRKELPMWVADKTFGGDRKCRRSTGPRGARGVWIFGHPGRMGGQLCKLVGKASSFSRGQTKKLRSLQREVIPALSSAVQN